MASVRNSRRMTFRAGWIGLLAPLLLVSAAGPGKAYVGDYESTFWRAWIMVSEGKLSSAAKSARVSYKGHMLKRYDVVNAHLERYEEMARTGTAEEREAAAAEVAFLKKRLEWMGTRADGNQWIMAEYEKPDNGALPFIEDDAKLIVQVYHDGTYQQIKAVEYERFRDRHDEADEFYREAIRQWERGAEALARRLADLKAEAGTGQPTVGQRARLDFLSLWADRYARTAEGVRAEYEAAQDPQNLVNQGLFYRQREWLYADDKDSEFESAYRKQAEYLFAKALRRCEQLIEKGEADASVRRLATALRQDDPKPPGEPIPAEYYDAVMEEYKMFTYFKEFWREDATYINID